MCNNLAVIRRQKKLTQKELADKLSVTRQYISDIERNQKVPSLSMALNISLILNTSVEKIFHL